MTRGQVTVPVIDIGGVLRGEEGALGRAAAELRAVVERIGFFYGSASFRATVTRSSRVWP